MNCNDSGRLLNAYLDSELDLPASLAIEEHLQGCARCRGSFGGLTALRSALSRESEPEPAPPALHAQVRGSLGGRPFFPPAAGRGIAWLQAAPGIAALLIVGLFMLARPWQPGPAPAVQARAVYHIASAENVGASLRTLKNHLDATPGMHVVVVAHNAGVDFLLRGARDESGRAYAETVRDFRERGVEFRVCINTLTRRQIDTGAVIAEAALVPSGIAEVSRLQAREGYTYLRL